MCANYEILNWDSEFFGFKVARITGHSKDDADYINEMILYSGENGVRVVYLISDYCYADNHPLIKKNNGKLVDTRLTFIKELSPVLAPIITPHITTNITASDIHKLNILAIESGLYSRFKIDNNFSKEQFESLYKKWIENSINKLIAEEVFIYKPDKEVLGFLTLKIAENKGSIGLLSVDANYRGSGIGSRLLQASELYCYINSIFMLQVITQQRNTAACQFYSKNGYRLKNTEYIYHFWF